MNQPLVTCLCLTMAGRSEFLKRAIECFKNQGYPFRELVIVADSYSDLDGTPRCNPRISVLVSSHHLNISEKRNLGCELAEGELIAVWDDDDYSSPGRLQSQVDELQLTGKAVTGFRSMKFTNGSNWWQFSYPERGLVLGTSLLFRREWWLKHPFKESGPMFQTVQSNIGEDAEFCGAAAAENQLAEVPDLGLMYATIHPGNTSKRKVTDPGWSSLPGFEWGK